MGTFDNKANSRGQIINYFVSTKLNGPLGVVDFNVNNCTENKIISYLRITLNSNILKIVYIYIYILVNSQKNCIFLDLDNSASIYIFF